MTASLIGYGTYLPQYLLAGNDIGLSCGDRVVASYDEDSTTSTPAYADKTNATAIHAALGLDD